MVLFFINQYNCQTKCFIQMITFIMRRSVVFRSFGCFVRFRSDEFDHYLRSKTFASEKNNWTQRVYNDSGWSQWTDNVDPRKTTKIKKENNTTICKINSERMKKKKQQQWQQQQREEKNVVVTMITIEWQCSWYLSIHTPSYEVIMCSTLGIYFQADFPNRWELHV